MNPINLDRENCITLMERAVEIMGGPEAVYEPLIPDTCQYVHLDPQTQEYSYGCLLGTMLNIAGVPLETIRSFDIPEDGGTSIADVLLHLERAGEVLLPVQRSTLLTSLCSAQRRQDDGLNLGSVLNKFKKEIRNE